MTEDVDYERDVLAACRAAVMAGASSWRDILHAAQGADPSVVFDAIERLHEDGTVADSSWEQLEKAARTTSSSRTKTVGPIPHPLDYVWHFNLATIDALLARIMAASAPGDTVIYLGTPLLHAAALRSDGGRHHVLLDRDPRVIAEATRIKVGSAFCVDLLGPDLPELTARVAIADPPWYTRECSAFVNAAATLLDTSGRLIVSFGSRLTRPSANQDLDVIIAAAHKDGLAFRSIDVGACGYLSPPFEQASLSTVGLPGMPSDWRRGDLLEFERVANHRPKRRTMIAEHWIRIDVNDIPLRVRPGAPSVGSELLTSVVANDQLTSVSRRDRVRDQVALWTSRNRAYGSRDAQRLAAIVGMMSSSASTSLTGTEKAVVEQIERVVALERHEHGLTLETAP